MINFFRPQDMIILQKKNNSPSLWYVWTKKESFSEKCLIFWTAVSYQFWALWSYHLYNIQGFILKNLSLLDIFSCDFEIWLGLFLLAIMSNAWSRCLTYFVNKTKCPNVKVVCQKIDLANKSNISSNFLRIGRDSRRQCRYQHTQFWYFIYCCFLRTGIFCAIFYSWNNKISRSSG